MPFPCLFLALTRATTHAVAGGAFGAGLGGSVGFVQGLATSDTWGGVWDASLQGAGTGALHGIAGGFTRGFFTGTIGPKSVVKAKSGADLSGGGRYRKPQTWIDGIVDEDVANVHLSHRPRYNGRFKDYGQAKLDTPGVPGSGRTTIGRPSLRSRNEMIDTIIHEETHHRLWARFLRGSWRAERLIDDIDIEEEYVEAVARRFLKMKGLISD